MNKPSLERCKKLLTDGYSLLTVGSGKKPNFSWKKKQTEPYTFEKFIIDYNYKGDKSYVDKSTGEIIEIPATEGIGIITGFNNIEVIDIDLKILPSLKEQQDFWQEYTTFLKESISDFDNKFVIYKTINNGFHIIYKCDKIDRNIKIAKLEGYKEAIIESRGIGGYVWIYENQISKYGYSEVKEISIIDRDTLWEISKAFDFIEPQPEQPKEVIKEYRNNISDITPWEDFNKRNSIWDMVSNEFTIVKKLSNKLIIKRLGAKSLSSGSIFLKDNKMYLFSTGTIYPHEKPLSPFDIYTIKFHIGNFSAAAKDLYSKNYGSRKVQNIVIKKKQSELIDESIQLHSFPLEIYPQSIQNYILECHNTLNGVIDFMGSAFLWCISLIIGNCLKIQIKNGWVETSVVWISLVGGAGIGKTPSVKHMTWALKKVSGNEEKRYNKAVEAYEAFMSLDKKEKKTAVEVKKPKKTQFIASSFTLEAIIELVEENQNGVGIFSDELASFYKDMNKYRQGSDKEFWLSSWSNESVSVNRKTTKNMYIESPIMPIIGGIQPNILTEYITGQNKDNGFVDRMLISAPECKIEKYVDKEMDLNITSWYSDYIVGFYNQMKKLLKYDNDGEIESHIARFSEDAKIEWIRIFNEITDIQNSDNESEYDKSMFPKQKAYIARFALLINTLAWYNNQTSNNLLVISKQSILAAEKLYNYFVAMAKKNKFETSHFDEMKEVVKKSGKITAKDKFYELYKANPNLNKSKTAELLNVSRVTINTWIKDFDKKV
jgi:hypothetical protein